MWGESCHSGTAGRADSERSESSAAGLMRRAMPGGSLIVEADECHQTQDRGNAGEKPEQPPDTTSEPQGERCGESSSHDWGCECNDCGRGSQVGGRRKREGGSRCIWARSHPLPLWMARNEGSERSDGPSLRVARGLRSITLMDRQLRRWALLRVARGLRSITLGVAGGVVSLVLRVARGLRSITLGEAVACLFGLLRVARGLRSITLHRGDRGRG